MRVTLVAKASSRAKLEKALDDISTRLETLAEVGPEWAFHVWADYAARPFLEEGPGWEGLSEVTASERERMGYSPYHPILLRQGELMASLTEWDNPRHQVTYRVPGKDYLPDADEDPAEAAPGYSWSIRTGSLAELSFPTPGTSELRFATLDERFRTLHRGNPQRNLPARPMLPEGQAEQEMVETMRRYLIGILVGQGGAHGG
jgi:hypothetical protein